MSGTAAVGPDGKVVAPGDLHAQTVRCIDIIAAAMIWALDGQVAAKASAVDPSLAAIDPQALAAQVAKIQDDGIRQMAAISQEISATVARIRQDLT